MDGDILDKDLIILVISLIFVDEKVECSVEIVHIIILDIYTECLEEIQASCSEVPFRVQRSRNLLSLLAENNSMATGH